MGRTAYFRRPDGAIVTRSITDVDGPIEVSITAPADWELIEEAEALAARAEHEAERERRNTDARAARDDRRQRAYEQLVELGLEADTAAFITGTGGAA